MYTVDFFKLCDIKKSKWGRLYFLLQCLEILAGNDKRMAIKKDYKLVL